MNSAQVELSRKQFGTEMNLLTRYLHKNVVRLIGFSSDGPQLCLIYEYLQRGALSHRLDCKVCVYILMQLVSYLRSIYSYIPMFVVEQYFSSQLASPFVNRQRHRVCLRVSSHIISAASHTSRC